MPYFVHLKGVEPSFGEPFAEPVEANTAARERVGHLITYKATEDESRHWKRRERNRFVDGVYQKPAFVEDMLQRAVAADTTLTRFNECRDYYVHLSKKQPGMIAYTPDEESGYKDRQVTIKPGKFLELVKDLYTTAEIAQIVADIKALGDPFKIATSADDIVEVYQGGPNSCMSEGCAEYSSHVHPTAVYGDSDLAIAYLGSKRHASARCIVWPEKKLYGRNYGDETLKVQLTDAGFTHSSYFDGARVRALTNDRGLYVMPYVDCANSASLSSGGKWFTLHRGESGDYAVKNTHGLTSEVEHYTCENCSENCEEGERYCDSCRGDLYSCARCGDDGFDESDFESIDDEYYCSSCASRYEHTCVVCEHTWFERNPDNTELCSTCQDTHSACDCGDYFRVLRNHPYQDEYGNDTCESCAHVPDDDTPIVATDDTDTLPLPLDRIEEVTPFTPLADDGADYRRLMSVAPMPFVRLRCLDEVWRPCAQLGAFGPFALHEARHTVGYTITHVKSGLMVMVLRSEQAAHGAMRALTPGANWDFDSRYAVSEDTRNHWRVIRDAYRAAEELI
jgi:hypothetical protein